MGAAHDHSQRLLRLLAPHHDRLRATARRLCCSSADGDDLFHEALERALAHLSELRDDGRFGAWFFAVLLSVHRSRHRRSFWRRLVSLDELTHHREPRSSEPRRDEAEEGARRTAEALATLSATAREAVVLFELEGMSIEEIAGLQRSSVSAVKKRLVRARADLRRHYEKRRQREARVWAGELS